MIIVSSYVKKMLKFLELKITGCVYNEKLLHLCCTKSALFVCSVPWDVSWFPAVYERQAIGDPGIWFAVGLWACVSGTGALHV